jgi:hypothetical protein
MDLKDNQSALILEIDKDDEITVEVASADMNGVTGTLCKAIANKLMQDVDFQEEMMEMIKMENE